MTDNIIEPSSDERSDAEQRTIAFFAQADIRALRRVLSHAKQIVTDPQVIIDIDSVWDCARWYFPDEFPLGKDKKPNTGPISKAMLLRKLKESKLLNMPQSPTPVISAPSMTSAPLITAPAGDAQLSCQFCGKAVSSTSGKTLHEKVCKNRPT